MRQVIPDLVEVIECIGLGWFSCHYLGDFQNVAREIAKCSHLTADSVQAQRIAAAHDPFAELSIMPKEFA